MIGAPNDYKFLPFVCFQTFTKNSLKLTPVVEISCVGKLSLFFLEMLPQNEGECPEGPVAYIPYVFHAYILSKVKENGIKSVARFLLELRCCTTTNEKRCLNHWNA
jgi:hypothetical protein